MQASRAGLEISYELSASGQQVNPEAWTKRACVPWAIRRPRDPELLDTLELDALLRSGGLAGRVQHCRAVPSGLSAPNRMRFDRIDGMIVHLFE
jgi:hypothetical protein